MPLFMAAYAGRRRPFRPYFASRAVREAAVYGVIDPGGILKIEKDIKSTQEMPEDVRRAIEASGAAGANAAAFMGSGSDLPSVPVRGCRPHGAGVACRSKATSSCLRDYLTKGVVDIYTPGHDEPRPARNRAAPLPT